MVKLLNVLNPSGSSAIISKSKVVGSASKLMEREVRIVPLESTVKKSSGPRRETGKSGLRGGKVGKE